MAKPTLIYDGKCSVCTRAANWVRENADGAFELLPCQSAERAERFPEMSEETCMEAMQLIFPDGRRFAGEQALPHLLRRMKGWRWLAAIVELPGLRHASPYVYRFFARHRYMFAAIAAHKRPAEGAACGIDKKCD